MSNYDDGLKLIQEDCAKIKEGECAESAKSMSEACDWLRDVMDAAERNSQMARDAKKNKKEEYDA